MLREELIFVGNCDIAGHVRGKGFPARELRARKKQGIGWTHSNLMQTAFGPILDTPFGTGGDLMVVLVARQAHLEHGRDHLATDVDGAVDRSDGEVAALGARPVGEVAALIFAAGVGR